MCRRFFETEKQNPQIFTFLECVKTGGISVKEVELFTLDRGVSWTIAMEAWRIILDTDDSDYRTPDLIDDDKRREVRVQFTGDRHHCNALGFTFTTMGTTTTNMRRRKKSI